MAGLYFEQFSVGQTFVHEIRRTVTDMDNILFSALPYNPAAVHIDHEFDLYPWFDYRPVRAGHHLGNDSWKPRYGRNQISAPGLCRRHPAGGDEDFGYARKQVPADPGNSHVRASRL